MKKIIKHIRRNWLQYGLETLVVVVGVLIAFSLNNWNNNQKNILLQKTYTENLRDELKNELLSFEGRLSEIDDTVSEINILLSSLNAKRDTLNEAQLNIMLTSIFAESARPPYNSVYKDLISTGNLALMDHTVRQQVLNYYNLNEFYTAHMNQEYKYNWEILLPFFNKSGIFKWETLNWAASGIENVQEDSSLVLLNYDKSDPVYKEAKNGLYFRKVMLLSNHSGTKEMIEAAKKLIEVLK